MEGFCIIIPNRPGREKLFDFCMYQISRMTLKPEMIYNIDYPAVSEDVDISERLVSGINMAKADGFDLCFVIENDDYYPADYFKRYGDMSEQFFGSQETVYYHIGNRTWSRFSHPNRSSLFTTGFRISALKNYIFPKNNPFVDLSLWKHAKPYSKKFILNTSAVGIKHGIGKCGGAGHGMVLSKKDPYYNWLRSNVDKESYEFYTSLL